MATFILGFGVNRFVMCIVVQSSTFRFSQKCVSQSQQPISIENPTHIHLAATTSLSRQPQCRISLRVGRQRNSWQYLYQSFSGVHRQTGFVLAHRLFSFVLLSRKVIPFERQSNGTVAHAIQ
jgi:hypothetical protein